jgi:hypothetical protein
VKFLGPSGRDSLGNIFEIYLSDFSGKKRKKFEFIKKEKLIMRKIFGWVGTLFFMDHQHFDGQNRLSFSVVQLRFGFPFFAESSETFEFQIQSDCSWALVNQRKEKVRSL